MRNYHNLYRIKQLTNSDLQFYVIETNNGTGILATVALFKSNVYSCAETLAPGSRPSRSGFYEFGSNLISGKSFFSPRPVLHYRSMGEPCPDFIKSDGSIHLLREESFRALHDREISAAESIPRTTHKGKSASVGLGLTSCGRVQ